MNKFLSFVAILFLIATIPLKVHAQANVLNPADPDVIFTQSFQPAPPAWNNYNITKWGHSSVLWWNPYAYGYKSYIYKGMVFRLKFPKTYQHNVNDGKKYPLFIFLHGYGESGTIHDNELSMAHGALIHAEKANNGEYDGFLLYPQSTTPTVQGYFPYIASLIDSLIKHVKVDEDRVLESGLSGGGQATWEFLTSYAKKFCAAVPICGARDSYINDFPNYITVPIWTSNGGQDNNPTPYTVTNVINNYRALGGNIQQTFFPDLGHFVWNDFWNVPSYWPFLSANHKANPLVFFQRTQFCPSEIINVKLGLQDGFFAYEWQKDGIQIAGANTNQVIVSSFGQYKGRFKRTSTSAWSDWSPTPVVISQKQATVTPPIQVNGLKSSVLPAPDGSTTVPLMVPNTYIGYEWRRVSDNVIVSTSNIYNAPVGQYKVMVTEQFGCSSAFSAPYTVIAAAGTNLPDMPTNFSAISTSFSSIQLEWNDNPAPLNNETAFEIYRSTTPGANYELVAVKGANVLAHLDNGLVANKRYYYVIRAINNNGAAPLSSEATAQTLSDITAPTAPTDLAVTTTGLTSVSLSWTASTDNIGVYKYDLYIDGVKAYTFGATVTTYTVNNLTTSQPYAFTLKARDLAGNISPASNQVIGVPVLSGLNYKYYQGTAWTELPDFNALTPFTTGITANVNLNPKQVNDNFGFLWEGTINIPVSGTYNFQTISDDGSKLYIDVPYSYGATPVVSNDFLHGEVAVTGSIYLTAGPHSFAATFFERDGGEAMRVLWQCAAAGIPDMVLIPDNAFANQVVLPPPPAKPGFLLANATSFKSITLNWTDNSNDETGFEIVRSTQLSGTYIPIGTTGAGITTYIDSIGLSSTTKYWYKVRAVNLNGQSPFISILEGNWGMNNDYNDASTNFRNITGAGSPLFSTDKVEGSHSISLNGSNQYADMPFSVGGGFPGNSYTTRTVAVWIKPTAATVSAANKVIFEFGGSDNGLGLRFNSNVLQAGIASGGIRATADVNSIATDPNWVNNGWNHVAVVYNINTLKIFVNGVEKTSTNLSFVSITNSASLSRIGATNGSNAFNGSTSSTQFGGLIDDFTVLTEPVNSQSLAQLMTQSYTSDTTLSLPPIPAVPSNLIALAQSPSSINLTWNDNSNNETGFEVYRSAINNSNFRFLVTVNPGNGAQGTYTDNSLFANTNYYYQVRAIGSGGNSGFTSTATAKTLNNRPVITDIANFTMRYNAQKTVSLTATDADGENVTLSILNKPSFGTFTITGNGTANLVLNPLTTANQGNYTISVIATDGNAGKDTTIFTVTVNSNYTPVINAISNVTMSEGSSTSVSVVATDQDGNGSLVLSMPTAPVFAALVSNGNGSGTINLTPGFAHAGVYPVTVTVNDGSGGQSSVSFTVTVTNLEVAAEEIFMRMRHDSPLATAPWNNITGVTTNNLVNSAGQTTPIGLQFLGTPWNTGNAGAQTFNNTGVYPDLIMRDYFWFGVYYQPETVNVKLTGLVATASYNVTIFGSSAWTGLGNNGTTIYTINGVAKPLYVHENTQNTVTFTSITPDASGNITINMSKGANTPYGVITSIVLKKPFNDGSLPVLPTNLTATALPDGLIRLNWNDVAYNESSYNVYRSLTLAGTYTLLNPGASNANEISYLDNTVSSNTTYYYKIAAVNSNGTSGQTNAVSATTGNKNPILTSINDIVIKGGTNLVRAITATDDPGNVLTTTIIGIPSFATYQSTGNGTGNLTFAPTVNDLGEYKNIIVKVTDNLGASATDTFNLTVTDSSLRQVYINYGLSTAEGGIMQAAPWNNWLTYPWANLPLTTMQDDNAVNTGFSIKLLQQWDGGFKIGMITGNSSGIFPDGVMKTSIYTTNNAVKTIQLDGLNPAKRYNVVFFTSHNGGPVSQVTFTSGAQSIVADAMYNSNTSVQLNGLVSSAAGMLQVTMAKNAAATYLNLNAMVIQEYNPTTPLLRPYNLFAESILNTDMIKLVWSDRSSDETGFQVWRATDPNGVYTLVTTTAANVTTYTNTGLLSNKRYFFRIKAIKGAVTSNYSNIATMIVPSRIVFINLNTDAVNNAPAPWNNTNGPSTVGVTLNLLNNALENTGFQMMITKAFNGTGYAGETGSGVFPGSVMTSNYWSDANQTSEVKFTNLDVRKKYRIGCFGSAIFFGYAVANYTCNGKTVQLNSYKNSTKVVYLDGLVPDADGELFVSVRNEDGYPYTFTSAYTLEAYDDTSTYSPPGLNIVEETETPPITNAKGTSPEVLNLAQTIDPAVRELPLSDAVNVYPNPFTNRIDVEYTNSKTASVTIQLYDLNAKLVYQSGIINTIAGKNIVKVNLPVVLIPGSYVLNVIANGKTTKSVKLIKVN
ncbi:MAG: LamG-like jellyroll fold domain-containing protein [Ferruginibacter sp.]